MADIALVTERRLEAPSEPGWYEANVLHEDRLLAAALAEHGLSTQRVDWARDDVDWSTYRAALIRTTWDYFDRPAEFRAWIGRVAAATRLFNPAETIRWNMDKHYLPQLAEAGVAVVATEILERGSERTLGEVMHVHAWPEVVFKPAVSGAGRHTYRVQAGEEPAHAPILARLLQAEAMLVQPFLPAVVADGEITVVVIDGTPTHALRKRAAPGEFRVQDDHGGTLHDHAATPAELALARRAIAACQPTPLYGRVDMVADADGNPVVMELELVEPELWFRRHPPAARRLAAALAAALG